MKDGLATLLQRRMDRRGFLELIGLALLGFLGVSRLLEAFQPAVKVAPTDTSSAGGYGSSAYGGPAPTPAKVRP